MSYRFVVIDLNIMWEEDPTSSLRATDRLVIPHDLGADILKSETGESHKRFFDKFVRQHQRRMIISHPGGILEEFERRRKLPVDDLGWIDAQSTKALRNLSGDAALNWDFAQSLMMQHEIGRWGSLVGFEEINSMFQQHMPEDHKKVRAGSADIHEIIRQPIFGPWIPGSFDEVYREPD